MTLIGMLHYRKKPDKDKKAYAYAAAAKMEGIPFLYFSYRGVDLESRKIEGWIYEEGKWEQRTMDFPQVIINISNPRRNWQKKIYRQLKKMIPFTSQPVPNKMKVYRAVKEAGHFANYMIPAFPLRKTGQLYDLLDQGQRIVIKPFSGNKGKGILFVDKMNESVFNIIDGNEQKVLDSSQFHTLIEKLKRERKYLFQPFIECRTRNGLTYDFRLHVQKNGLGEWELNLIYPRISGSSKLISNISGGGYRGELDSFLKEEFGDEYFNIKRLLEQFAYTFSSHLETVFNRKFDELGIDVGIDPQHKLWVFEVNWRPGSQHREFGVAKRAVKYAKYLATRH
ncbi:YheC/YheD family protein [Bacillus sp. FJAT-27251]|uniref:YheC/YheD family protein n=1 Tax=Bacillus sp. FJAT-27251 TaxID=1684142 RepID=UPI0006A79724|nr:YheC/YheD family protein [Bacillus sp. FJAT-27251]